jgi:hypothetical protein
VIKSLRLSSTVSYPLFHEFYSFILSDWYDNEHIPGRLRVPGFINCIRYKATDSMTPSWLATYDLDSPSVTSSQSYKTVAAQASDRERALIPRLASFNRRLYGSYSVKVNPQIPPDVLPAKFLFVVALLVEPELDEEYNRWFEEEYLLNLAKAPGWYRSRRYKLISNAELARGDGDKEDPIHNYVTIHDWAHDNYLELPEYAALLTTPSSCKMIKEITAILGRSFAIYKVVQKPE